MSNIKLVATTKNLLFLVTAYGIVKIIKNKDRKKDKRIEKVFLELEDLKENKQLKVFENEDEILLLANDKFIKHSFITNCPVCNLNESTSKLSIHSLI